MLTKDPNSNVRFYVNWKRWLGTEVISSSEWVTPDGLTASSPTHTDTVAYVLLSGGVIGNTYKVVNRITTDGGQSEDQTLEIYIRNK